MIERKRKPTDTTDIGVCMCMGRGMVHHNLQWEDILVKMKGQRKRDALPSFCLFRVEVVGVDCWWLCL